MGNLPLLSLIYNNWGWRDALVVKNVEQCKKGKNSAGILYSTVRVLFFLNVKHQERSLGI